MSSGLKKFRLLLWKNYILQKRHKIQTVMELLVPLFFSAVIVAMRGIVSSTPYNEPTHFEPFDVTEYNDTAAAKGCFVLYAPNGTIADRLMDDVWNNHFANLNYSGLRGYPNEEQLVAAYTVFAETCDVRNISENNKNPVLGAVVFENVDGKETWKDMNDIRYSLRFPAILHNGGRWFTELLYPVYQILGPRQKPDEEDLNNTENSGRYLRRMRGGIPGYWSEGFLYLQQSVERAIRSASGDGVVVVPQDEKLKLQRMPYPQYIDDVFIIALQNFLPLIVVFSFIYTVVSITKSITHEKEKRLKESMKMMGLPNWLHWTAWFLKSYVLISISIILMVILLKIKFYQEGKLAVLTYSDGTLFCAFLLIYAFCMVTLSFLISTLFSAANAAATAAGVIFFLSYFPYIFLQQRYENLGKTISMWEGTGAGIQWSNIGTLASPDDNWTLLDITIMLMFDGFLYLFLAIYVEGVWPGEFGMPLPWYFPFMKWYWLGIPREDAVINVVAVDARQKKPESFEKEPDGRAGVQIRGLTKVFRGPTGAKTVVKNLYINMFENQVTAFLGHNGAGKSTTFSMLTGLYPPTSGTAFVNGFNIRHDIKSVRDNFGFCPQHDVLFDEMTVTEHLRFFAKLKGCNGDQLVVETARMLKAINLEAKAHTQAMSLSGGMKRRLSVGIAFVGGSRVVLLDEPSSGLDPGARRKVWDLIQAQKKGRTIIISTHFMDEADILGDRIAILVEGQVQCCGSSLFLKKKYGGGYHLVIVKQSYCDVNRITKFLRVRIPNVEIDQNVGSELSYSLPDGLSHLFADLFEELEQRKEELGIASYGASNTQMEEVFMRVGKEAEDELLKDAGVGMMHAKMENDHHDRKPMKFCQTFERNTGFKLLKQQMWAMIVKKFLYTIRNKVLLGVQTIIPIAFLIITLVMLRTLPNITSPPSLDLSLQKYNDYGATYTTMDCKPEEGSEFCSKYEAVASVFSNVEKVVSVPDKIIRIGAENLPLMNFGYIAGLETNGVKTYKGYFNNQPYHAPPVALNLISNALLKSIPGNSEKNIYLKNYPLPLNTAQKIDNLIGAQSSGFNIGFTVSFGMSFLAASFVVFLIKERETNAKHLQVVSGVRFQVFWIASFLFDALNFILPCLGLLIVLVVFQSEDFASAEMIGHVFLLLLTYGWCVIPFMYIFSFAFTIPSSGFTWTVMFNIFSGMATILTITIFQVLESMFELKLRHITKVLEWIFMLFPNFNLGYGLAQLSANFELHQRCPYVLVFAANICTSSPENFCCTRYNANYLGWKSVGIGRNLLFMFFVGLVCFIIILVVESKIIQRIKLCGTLTSTLSMSDDEGNDLLDDDVAAEKARIKDTDHTELCTTDNLVLRDLKKMYGKLKAVDSLCLGVQKGECFSLLGINGAGKSTTFKMLTGDIPVTSGDAFVYAKSVKSDIKKVQQDLGYCPQFDALIPELTGRETIRLFARLRGVKEPQIDVLADALAAKLLFGQYIDKQCCTYSGGNKRKLSTALALVGNPPMVLLDEPTTGMDPVARRHLWDAISDVRKTGTSIVLTSHSMDECEALSTRLAIMVNGVFRCLGSTQHLKNKFGEGYSLIAQIETGRDEHRGGTRQSLDLTRRQSSNERRPEWEAELQPLRAYIERTFPDCEMKDMHSGYVHYHIKNDWKVTWGYMFKKMEEAKREFKIQAYSVGQTTLEQVFLNLTRQQAQYDED